MDSTEGAKDYVGIRKGLPNGKSLGELEAQVLDVIWDLESPVTTTKVFKVIVSEERTVLLNHHAHNGKDG